jgi:hypothetical protein
VDTRKLLADLESYHSHVGIAIVHLRLALEVGQKRGRGRPRKLTADVDGARNSRQAGVAEHVQLTDNNRSGQEKTHSGF